MGKVSLIVVCLLAGWPVLFAAAPPPAVEVRSGMSMDEVRAIILHPPVRIARQVLHGHYHEVWYYDSPRPLWIEFDCRKAVEARVINVRSGIKRTP
jgi:hypothetical protein